MYFYRKGVELAQLPSNNCLAWMLITVFMFMFSTWNFGLQEIIEDGIITEITESLLNC